MQVCNCYARKVRWANEVDVQDDIGRWLKSSCQPPSSSSSQDRSALYEDTRIGQDIVYLRDILDRQRRVEDIALLQNPRDAERMVDPPIFV